LRAFGLGPFESVKAFGALGPFEGLDALAVFDPDILDAGRPGDRLAAARRCFGMQY
jgi:hypothetical protein